MPTAPAARCSRWPCPKPAESRGLCATHRSERNREVDARRPSAARRGYDRKWRRIRAQFLKANPWCVVCGEPATEPDHDPITRAELVARGDPHPDAWRHLKPKCKPHHSQSTAAAAWHGKGPADA